MVRDADSVILGVMQQPDLDEGPQTKPASPTPDGVTLEGWEGEFDRSTHPDAAVAIWVDGAPVWMDPTTLDELRAAKVSEINAAWMAADSTSFIYAGEAVGAEADDIVRLNSINGYIGLIGSMPPDWPGVWKTKANTFLPLADVDAWKPFYTAFVTKGVTNYMAAQLLKAQIADATTAAELAVIVWAP